MYEREDGATPDSSNQPPAWPEPPAAPDYGPPPDYSQSPPGYGQPPLGYGQPPPAGGGIHPLTVGRAFSLGWNMFRFRWRPLIGALAAVTVPALALNVLATLVFGGAVEQWIARVQAWANVPRANLATMPPFPVEALLLLLLTSVVASILGLVGFAAVINLLGWTYGRGHSTAVRALGAAARRLLTLIGIGLLIVLTIIGVVLIGLGIGVLGAIALGDAGGVLLSVAVFVATFVVVILLVLRWAFAYHVAMLEGAGAVAALGRSWRLVSGSMLRVLGYLLLWALVLIVVGLVVGVVQTLVFGLGVDIRTGQAEPFSPTRAAAQTILPSLIALITTPLYAAVTLLLYYDLRWRRGEEIGPPPD